MGLGQLPTDIREQLALIEKAALDAAEVVRRLQGFTRQQRQGSHQIVDLGEVCSDVVELLRPLWASRRRHGRTPIVVRLVAAHDLLVRGEATELREVLTNLVKNSLEALETGGSITVGAERVGDFARVSVEDDGCGIPEDQIQRLFTPFFTTKGDRGTGLGLCLCQQIVERHAGNLVISSRVGEGTKAEFRLPIASLEPQKRAKEAPAARIRMKILVVDDDPDVLSPLCDYLSRSGFEVTGLPGGAEALVELQRVLPDLVLTDVAMPITDGIEVCRRTRVLRPGLPVVLMSGQASGIDPAVVREAGAAALLAKPFTMRQVLDLIAQITSGPRSEATTLHG
jgi:CheY-like chemotaxis protein/anti-sigma regulatory factor (Ser/Thr protein kinase)